MRRIRVAIALVSTLALVAFFSAPLVVTGQSCDCISGPVSNPSHNIYSSFGCATLGVGTTYWKGSLYLTCSPPIPVMDPR
jgi:hypothetical protein